jgi:hypothetical protein
MVDMTNVIEILSPIISKQTNSKLHVASLQSYIAGHRIFMFALMGTLTG